MFYQKKNIVHESLWNFCMIIWSKTRNIPNRCWKMRTTKDVVNFLKNFAITTFLQKMISLHLELMPVILKW